ncbi:MAG: sigma-54 dependent transcriptional regulator [bacterium]
MAKILVLDPDKIFCKNIFSKISLINTSVQEVSSPKDALKALSTNSYNIIILNLTMAHTSELDLISYIKVNFDRCDVIVCVDIDDIEMARKAMHKGAYLYLLKPVTHQEVQIVINKILQSQEKESHYIESQSRLMQELVGNSKKMQRILQIAKKVAPTTGAVLITGESGTGKEVFARYIHMMSKRHDGHFVAINCGAIPENLVESELFGHKRGAFTGASLDKKGMLEEANLGTVFLDEIGDLSLHAQTKILRFLQEYEIRPVGSNSIIKVDVRVMAATNKNLLELVEKKEFREDLFYRLNIVQIHLPPLRERKENIPHLVKFFVFKYCQQMDRRLCSIHPEAEAMLMNYDYKGNIRELENIIERAVIMSENDIIKRQDMPENMVINRPLLSPGKEIKAKLDQTLEELERNHIAEVMERYQHNQTEAAKVLGISRSTLWRKLKSYNMV